MGQWFYEELAGIKPAAAGYSKITIQPLPGGQYGVEHAAASVDTVRGLIRSGWTQAKDGSLKLDVTIPANTTATVYVPATAKGKVTEGNRPAHQSTGVRYAGHRLDAEVYEVGSGTYSFRVTA
ncbi:alpha-L-rhamnosidase C-terminal domain-containing protein [Actinoplanes couchii]|uniref:alpha-L-rhamnosidase C-terminal domain-containing protein n=1 Tax=Actinoplanes couchii TaxID=403638 RepID=UPI0031DEEBFD